MTPTTADDGRLLYPVNHCIRIHLPGVSNPHNLFDASSADKVPLEDWRQPFTVCLIGFQVPLLTRPWQAMTCQLIKNLSTQKNIRLSHLKEVCHDTRVSQELKIMEVVRALQMLFHPTPPYRHS
ncbi:unnamed protein product [Dibothriocephalus latus]|uniref:Uncharacterized protein n=1 Tax=Dibothriocephalus latus TaxID=60516 RepID=A0A3P7MUF3_DIBLA|nr:unnamed protein product [Dibothriocephalus latus]